MLWCAIQNYGHVPLFAVLAAVLFHLVRSIAPIRPGFLYPLVFGLTMMLGLVSEVLQIAGPREAELSDLFSDAFGAGAALLFHVSRDRRVALAPGARKGAVVAAGALLLLPLIQVAIAGVTTARRSAQFPVLCSFEAEWEMRLVKENNTRVEAVKPPPAHPGATGRRVAKVTFYPTDRWAGFGLPRVFPDWRGYATLAFDVWSPADSTRCIAVVIRDSGGGESYGDRYNGRFDIPPGASTVRVSLAEIRNAPRERTMNMARISSLTLSSCRRETQFTLYLDNVRLENAG
jgi:hypothetical protein